MRYAKYFIIVVLFLGLFVGSAKAYNPKVVVKGNYIAGAYIAGANSSENLGGWGFQYDPLPQKDIIPSLANIYNLGSVLFPWNNLYVNNAYITTTTITVIASSTLFRAQDGSATIPSYSWNDDTNSGLYRIGADNIGLTLNGVLNWSYKTTNAVASLASLLASGTDDLGLRITQTLNNNSAGGTDMYRGLDLNVTLTDSTGWNTVKLYDFRANGNTINSLVKDATFGWIWKLKDETATPVEFNIMNYAGGAAYPRTYFAGGQDSTDTNWIARFFHKDSLSTTEIPAGIQISTNGNTSYTNADTLTLVSGLTYALIATNSGAGSSGLPLYIGTHVTDLSNVIQIGTVATGQGITILSSAATGGVPKSLTISPAANLATTASTDNPQFLLSASTQQHATGAINEMGNVRFDSPTFTFVGSSVATSTYNVKIARPIHGANSVPLTTASLFLENGVTSSTVATNIYNEMPSIDSGVVNTLGLHGLLVGADFSNGANTTVSLGNQTGATTNISPIFVAPITYTSTNLVRTIDNYMSGAIIYQPTVGANVVASPTAATFASQATTSTIAVLSESGTKGACLELTDASGVGRTYLTVEDGIATFSATSCK